MIISGIQTIITAADYRNYWSYASTYTYDDTLTS